MSAMYLVSLLIAVQLAELRAAATSTSPFVGDSASGLHDVIVKLQDQLKELQHTQARADHTGAVYTRWGRTDCPTDATLVYSGLTAGAYHRDGTAIDLQCLVSNPRYSRYSDYQWGGILYPAIYKLQRQDEPYSDIHTNGHAACAVCLANGKTSTFMYPGTNQCPTGWSAEYSGYLMAGNFNLDQRSMFNCFDDDIQDLIHVSNYTSSNNLYVVGVDCRNNNRCPPYFNAREITCAVCSK